MRISSVRQSSEFESFRCLGPACEDTCCGGWAVAVDRTTYEKYQTCTHPEILPQLRQLVTINTAHRTSEDFARISLIENQCPFLTRKLCALQLAMGETYLSNTCAIYPRAINIVDGVAERSLHLSCPEAARLVLLNQQPFDWTARAADVETRYGAAPVLEGKPYPLFQPVRSLFLSALRANAYPLSRRIEILGELAEEFNAIQPGGDTAETGHFLWHSLATLHNGTFPPGAKSSSPLTLQLEVILELVVARVSSDATPPRFLDCYRDFMQGLDWGPDSTLEALAGRFADARIRLYEPFIRQHPYLLENFLTNYALQNVFPYGHREFDQKLRVNFVENAVRRQYLLLAAHYAAVRALLIGTAAFHGETLGVGNVIKLIQSYAKTFQHSTTYPAKALQILAAKGIHTARAAAVLFQDL